MIIIPFNLIYEDLFVFGKAIFFIQEEKRTININLAGITPGDDALGGGSSLNNSHGSYYPDYPWYFQWLFIQTGIFHLASLDTLKRVISATFSGSVQNLKGESMEITDGRIENGRMNFGIIRY